MTGSRGYSPYWMDLYESSRAVPGTWVWLHSGEPLLFSAWSKLPVQQPNVRSYQCCVINAFDNDILWNDLDCSFEYAYICEKENIVQ